MENIKQKLKKDNIKIYSQSTDTIDLLRHLM